MIALQDDLTAKHAVQPPTTKGVAGKKSILQKTVSVQIRITLVQALRCIRHYSNHLGGFEKPVDELGRMTYNEDKEGLELDDEEKATDDKRAEEELEVLGAIGFKNAKEPYVKFPDAIAKVDEMCRTLC
jgi:hypothetical protein